MSELHWSQLRNMAKSPKHFKYCLDKPFKPTPAMRFGSLVDALLFGTFDGKFKVFGQARRGKAWADYKEKYGETHEIVTQDEHSRAWYAVESIQRSSEAMRAIERGDWQKSETWEVAGVKCAGTADVFGNGLVELKVTSMIHPERFSWHARRMMWHAQLAWYAHGLGVERDEPISIVAVEPKPPYDVAVYDLTENCIQAGHRLWSSLFEQYQGCVKTDHWPGCGGDGIKLFDVPDDDTLSLVLEGEEIEL